MVIRPPEPPSVFRVGDRNPAILPKNPKTLLSISTVGLKNRFTFLIVFLIKARKLRNTPPFAKILLHAFESRAIVFGNSFWNGYANIFNIKNRRFLISLKNPTNTPVSNPASPNKIFPIPPGFVKSRLSKPFLNAVPKSASALANSVRPSLRSSFSAFDCRLSSADSFLSNFNPSLKSSSKSFRPPPIPLSSLIVISPIFDWSALDLIISSLSCTKVLDSSDI